MQAVLYVAHGSRMQAGVDEAIRFIERVRIDVPVPIQEISFLELAAPTILQGIENCIKKGATEIAVIPILLLSAHHAKVDIPIELGKAQIMYPNLNITYGRPFGIHPKLVESIFNRVVEQQHLDRSNAKVLLVGRGSSDENVRRDLNEIAKQLQNSYGFSQVNTCFLYGKGPSFEQTLEQMKKSDTSKVFIVPYLLFTGLLRRGIEKKIHQLENQHQEQFVLCESLGYDENVRSVLLERVFETLPVSKEYCYANIPFYNWKMSDKVYTNSEEIQRLAE